MLEDDGKNENYIIGVLMSIIDHQTKEYSGFIQDNINLFIKEYKHGL